MKNLTWLLGVLLFSLTISGCASGIKNLEAEWGAENQSIQNVLGLKTYELPKEKAMAAMLVAFQRLDMIVENSDFTTGIITAIANAPKPLTHEEFERVKEVETGRARKHVAFFFWNLSAFKSKFNAVFLSNDNAVQISLRANLIVDGDRSKGDPVMEFPPEGLKIGFAKVWNEFEKVAFIQEQTLSQN